MRTEWIHHETFGSLCVSLTVALCHLEAGGKKADTKGSYAVHIVFAEQVNKRSVVKGQLVCFHHSLYHHTPLDFFQCILDQLRGGIIFHIWQLFWRVFFID